MSALPRCAPGHPGEERPEEFLVALHEEIDQRLPDEGLLDIPEQPTGGPVPPASSADMAMKRDLDALEERLELRFTGIDQRFGALDAKFDARLDALEYKVLAALRGELHTALTAQGRQLAITLAGTAGALSALAFAAARAPEARDGAVGDRGVPW